MATVTLTVTPSSPNHGDTITATYVVSGNDGTPAQSDTVSGSVVVGSQTLQTTTTVTLPAVAPLSETYATPTAPGLTFNTTANPKVFTAVVA